MTSGGGVRAAAPLTAPAVTVGLYLYLCLWRRNALPSVLGGTATHLVLTGTVFAR